MSRDIQQLYKKSGVSMKRAGIKKGKGIHTKEAHSCVIDYIKGKGLSAKEAWKRCIGGLGRDIAVKKSHWQGKKPNEAIRGL